MLALVSALGYRSVAGVFGHDQGSPLAGWCALTRPDVFKSVILMSSPFRGAPESLPFNTVNVPAPATPVVRIHEDLARLTPPRKYYMKYYTQPEANENIWHPKQGLHAFLRAYYHMKSADWYQNRPHSLGELSAQALSQLPHYYVMEHGKNMPESVTSAMPDAKAIAQCDWLPDNELAVYCAEYERTGFQGGLQWYRCLTSREQIDSLRLFGGLTIDVPSCFIAGASDWGVHQIPGAFDKMQQQACTRMLGCHLIPGAGHWVQQEQPEAVLHHLFGFFERTSA
jgi:pimeloyl-ACP methyl ester carboxylesterase